MTQHTYLTSTFIGQSAKTLREGVHAGTHDAQEVFAYLTTRDTEVGLTKGLKATHKRWEALGRCPTEDEMHGAWQEVMGPRKPKAKAAPKAKAPAKSAAKAPAKPTVASAHERLDGLDERLSNMDAKLDALIAKLN